MNPNHTQSPDEMMRETEKTRAGIEDNLEALENRLSPDDVLDQVGRAVLPARDGAVQFARNLGDTIRENPIPAAMVGIGLGWLLLSGRPTEAAAGDRRGRVDPSRPASHPTSDDSDDASAGRVHEAKEWARQRSEEVRENVSDSADTAYRRASDTAHRAGARISDGSADIGNFVQRRPILTGMAIAGIGAVIAAAVFARTDRGKKVVARATDTVKDGSHRVSEAVRATAHDVSDAAAEAASAAGERLNDAMEKTRRGAGGVRDGVAQVGAGEIEQHDTGGGGQGARPGSQPGTTMDSTPVPPSARKQ